MTFTITNVVLAFISNAGLSLYLAVYIIEYLVLTFFLAPRDPGTQKISNLINYVLFSIFILVVIQKVIEIWGANLP
ncbi:MAG: hypothetical protein NWE92_09150 [Candidatus Bathyarchaeota archaeon]|nr:hypothetical protein [Candidatus Bathyarchaeota archaeon]